MMEKREIFGSRPLFGRTKSFHTPSTAVYVGFYINFVSMTCLIRSISPALTKDDMLVNILKQHIYVKKLHINYQIVKPTVHTDLTTSGLILVDSIHSIIEIAANDPKNIDVINKAIKQFSDYTCLSWVPRGSTEAARASYSSYIEFFSGRYRVFVYSIASRHCF